ncbi:MAG: hypothetical protein WC369_08960 [Dehalococcoidales bacterium]
MQKTDCIELIARAEHRSKVKTRQLLIEEGIKRHLETKLESGLPTGDRVVLENTTSAGIEMVARMEHKRKSETQRFLIDEGIRSYVGKLEERIKMGSEAGKPISKSGAASLIRKLVKLSN